MKMEDKYLFSYNNVDYTVEKLQEELTVEQFEKVKNVISREDYSVEEIIKILPSLDSGDNTVTMLNSRIKEMRIENGLTQSDVANVLDISQREYWRMEQDGFNPNFLRIATLARFYNVSMDWFSGLCNKRLTFGTFPENARVWCNGYNLQEMKEAKAKGEKIKPNTFDSLA